MTEIPTLALGNAESFIRAARVQAPVPSEDCPSHASLNTDSAYVTIAARGLGANNLADTVGVWGQSLRERKGFGCLRLIY